MSLFSATAVLPDTGNRLKSAGLAAVFAIASVGAAVAPLFYYQSASAATNNVLVTPSNSQGWVFAQETPTGSGSFVNGPATPPLGTGSANLIVDSTGGEVLVKPTLQGTKFADIDTLKYSTYRTSGTDALAIALQFDFDNDVVTDTDTAFKGRLVYEPYHTQTVSTGTWQTWDTLNDATGSGLGNWWLTNGTQASTIGCTHENPCTWGELLQKAPNAGIRNTATSGVWLKAGGGWTGGFNGNVDALTIAVGENETVYNFEAVVPVTPPAVVVPEEKDDCKNNGWKTVKTAENKAFKNQGQCVSYVEKNSKEVRGNIRYSAGGLDRAAWFRMDTADDRGWFVYEDANRDWYGVRVSEVKVDGNTAWFAGRVDRSKNGKFNGQWLFAKVVDGNPDTISGSFTTRALAEAGVEGKLNPTDGPFNVTRGNIRIKD